MAFRPKQLTPNRSARHWFGAELRRCREAAGLSLEALARIVSYDKSLLSRVETAAAMVPEKLPPLLDAAFGTDGHFQRAYGLARREIHPDQFRRRMEMEERARLIQEYCCQVVPGLVQTADYARAVFEDHNPCANPEEIDQLVTARMSRQAVFGADPVPEYSVILDEAAVRRTFGGPHIMRAQLSRLIELALSPAIVQVLPFTSAGHGLVGGSLSLLGLGDGTQVAWEEAITTGTLIEHEPTVARLRRAYDRLRARALPPSDSVVFLRSVMEALPHEQQPRSHPRAVGKVLVQRQWRRPVC